MPIDTQIADLQAAVDAFAAAVESVPAERYLEKLNGWATRDIVAHLVGWNRLAVDGSRQILQGELPDWAVDPGENYSKVNAVSVEKYASTDRDDLLAALRASTREMEEFLRSLDADDWERDFGVRLRDIVITIRLTFDGLASDYRHHTRQIQDWLTV
jgi:uncharacterized protein (TIGR03083 family)